MLLPHFGVDVDASRVTICDSAEFTRGVGWLGVFVSDPKKMLRPVWKQKPGAEGIKEIAKIIYLSLWCVLRVAQPCLASMRQDIWNTCQCSADRMADCLTSWNKSFRWCDVITKFANAADGVLSKRVTWRERHSQDTTCGCGSTILSSRAQEGSQSPFLRLDSLCVRKKTPSASIAELKHREIREQGWQGQRKFEKCVSWHHEMSHQGDALLPKGMPLAVRRTWRAWL